MEFDLRVPSPNVSAIGHERISRYTPAVNKQNQKCKLCGNTAPLCRSHIVPDFAYRPIKDGDEKGQMLAVGRKVKKVQTGHWERLLCSQCEGILNRYETKFKKVWMDTIPPDFKHVETEPPKDAIVVDIPDYVSFKLFHLSVLWRATVSTSFKISHSTSLGPYERIIAEMILEGNPGQLGDFPFFAHLIVDKRKQPVPTVAPLAECAGRLDGLHHYYMMTYAYCEWFFVIAQPGPQWLIDFEKRCRDDGVFVLSTVPFEESKSIALWAKIHGKHMKR